MYGPFAPLLHAKPPAGCECVTQPFDGDLMDWEDETRFPRIDAKPNGTTKAHIKSCGNNDYKAVPDKNGKAVNLYRRVWKASTLRDY